MYQTKLPTPKLAWICPEPDDEDEIVEAESDVVNEAAATPPVEDCSAPATQPLKRGPKPTAKKAAKPLPEESCISGVSAELLARMEETQPVQPRAGERERQRGQTKQERRKAFLSGS